MSENGSELDWGSVDVDESVSEADHKKAENLTAQTPVGKFRCRVLPVTAAEKTLKEYSCVAASLKMEVIEVLELEQPVFDDAGKPVVRNGEQLMRKKIIDNPKEKALVNETYRGLILADDVFLHNPKEKEAIKNRRLFVARKIGILDEKGTVLTGRMWQSAEGREVIVITDWNRWEDKVTKELKKNVKVAFDGYEAVNPGGAGTGATPEQEIDFSGV